MVRAGHAGRPASTAAAAPATGGAVVAAGAAAIGPGQQQQGHQHLLQRGLRSRRLRVGSVGGGAARIAQGRRATSYGHHPQQRLRPEQQGQLWLLAQLQQLGLGGDAAEGGAEGLLEGEGLAAVPEMVLRFLQDEDADAADDEVEAGAGEQ